MIINIMSIVMSDPIVCTKKQIKNDPLSGYCDIFSAILEGPIEIIKNKTLDQKKEYNSMQVKYINILRKYNTYGHNHSVFDNKEIYDNENSKSIIGFCSICSTTDFLFNYFYDNSIVSPKLFIIMIINNAIYHAEKIILKIFADRGIYTPNDIKNEIMKVQQLSLSVIDDSDYKLSLQRFYTNMSRYYPDEKDSTSIQETIDAYKISIDREITNKEIRDYNDKEIRDYNDKEIRDYNNKQYIKEYNNRRISSRGMTNRNFCDIHHEPSDQTYTRQHTKGRGYKGRGRQKNRSNYSGQGYYLQQSEKHRGYNNSNFYRGVSYNDFNPQQKWYDEPYDEIKLSGRGYDMHALSRRYPRKNNRGSRGKRSQLHLTSEEYKETHDRLKNDADRASEIYEKFINNQQETDVVNQFENDIERAERHKRNTSSETFINTGIVEKQNTLTNEWPELRDNSSQSNGNIMKVTSLMKVINIKSPNSNLSIANIIATPPSPPSPSPSPPLPQSSLSLPPLPQPSPSSSPSPQILSFLSESELSQ